MWRLGIDEAGRGPCLGPLVVACVAVPESEVHILTSMGVKDSKRLTTVARERLHEKILQARHSSGWRVTCEVLPASSIDLAVKDRGLNRLEYLAFATLLDRMHEPGTDAMAVLDACDVDESRFRNQVMARLELEHHGLDVVARHGADDDDPVVAAASIIAKVERDKAVRDLGTRLGLDIGSGYPSDVRTISALRTLLSRPKLEPDLRWSWATIHRIWSEVNEAPLPVRTGEGLVRQDLLL